MDPPFRLSDSARAMLAERRMVSSVATRDARLRPHLALGLGYRVLDDARRLELLLDADAAREVLADLHANGEAAVVFSEPSTHRTLQLKGRALLLREAGPEHRDWLEAYRRRFADEVLPLGFSAEYARTTLQVCGTLWLVRIELREGFEQTPGAQAGTPLSGSA